MCHLNQKEQVLFWFEKEDKLVYFVKSSFFVFAVSEVDTEFSRGVGGEVIVRYGELARGQFFPRYFCMNILH